MARRPRAPISIVRRTLNAGLLGALAVALFEAGLVLARADTAPPLGDASWLPVALLGLYAPLSLAIALLLGVGLWLLPERLRPNAWRERARTFFAARDATAPERASRVVGVCAAAAAGLSAAFVGARALLERVGDARATGLWLALFGAATCASVLWLHRPLAGIAARALVPLSRTSLGARLATPRVVLALVALATTLGVFVIVTSRAETVSAIPFAPLVVALALALSPVALGGVVRGVLAHRGATIALAALAVGASAATFTLASARPKVGFALTESGAFAPRVLKAYWAALDRDGDGYAGQLWGGDCDDTNPRVFPGAPEIPDNGIDEDCDGKDLKSRDLEKLLARAAPATPATTTPTATMKSDEPPRSVLLVTVDTLRADHLSCYGYARPTTPALDAFAARSVRFERAYSPSAYTPQAVPAMLTGRYPSELVRTFAHFSRYPKGNRFIAERLKTKGYRTAAIVSHFYFRKPYGFAAGFDDYDTTPIPVNDSSIDNRETSEGVTRAAERWLERNAGLDSPFFLWVHYLDPHKNYLRHKDHSIFGNRAIDLYDGEVRYTDHHFARLLRAFERHKASKRAAVIFTADHGEGFGEHGYRFHGRSLYDDQIRVPLIIHVPGAAPGVRKSPVGLVDVAVTLADLAGLPPQKDDRGISLLPNVTGAVEPPFERPILGDMPPAPLTKTLRCLVKGHYKLIHYVAENQFFLFNLTEDPAEKRNLLRHERERARAMQDELRAHFSVTLKVRPALGMKKKEEHRVSP